jgi:hypothetical protein
MEIINQYFITNKIYKNMTTRIWYLIITWYVAIAFRAVLMWMDKMTKVIIWNYLSWITCYAFWNLINQCVVRLSSTPDAAFLWITYAQYAKFLSAGQLTFVLLLFAWLIRLIYSFGKIQVSYNTNISSEKLYFIILIPITILSFIIWPYIALQATWIQAISEIENSITQNFWFLKDFINQLPFWMFINGIAFIIISSHINFKISFSTKKTTLPEWI